MLQVFGSTAVSCDESVLVYGRTISGKILITSIECAESGNIIPHEIIWSDGDFAIQLPTQKPFILRWKDDDDNGHREHEGGGGGGEDSHSRQDGHHAELVQPHLAFDAAHLPLNCSKLPREQRMAISTMTTGDDNRVQEWVRYHSALGVTDFLIFHNSHTPSSVLIDLAEEGVSVIEFPYAAAEGEHWNNVQRAALNIGAATLRERVAFVAFTDVDEFIAIADGGSLLDLMRTVGGSAQLTGSVLTNEGAQDAIQNNVLTLATRYCEEAEPKIVLSTLDLSLVPFVASPHVHVAAASLDKTKATFFHMWLNDRCTYAPEMRRLRLNGQTHWQVEEGLAGLRFVQGSRWKKLGGGAVLLGCVIMILLVLALVARRS